MHTVYSRERAPPRHKTGAASNQRHAKNVPLLGLSCPISQLITISTEFT